MLKFLGIEITENVQSKSKNTVSISFVNIFQHIFTQNASKCLRMFVSNSKAKKVILSV